MFQPSAVCKLLDEVTTMFRKGEEVITKQVGNITVTDVYMMPHVSEASAALEIVDVWFINVGVDAGKAAAKRDELADLLAEWPQDTPLTGGLSYIAFGGILGSQDYALRLMAAGKVMGFWKIIHPGVFGFEGDEANRMAEAGFVMASGYNPEKVAA
jgi:hypothetical protein